MEVFVYMCIVEVVGKGDRKGALTTSPNEHFMFQGDDILFELVEEIVNGF